MRGINFGIKIESLITKETNKLIIKKEEGLK